MPALQEPPWGCPWSQPALFLIYLEQLPSSTTHFRSMLGVFSLHQGSNFPPCHGESSGSSTEVAASGRTPKGRSRKGVSESSWRWSRADMWPNFWPPNEERTELAKQLLNRLNTLYFVAGYLRLAIWWDNSVCLHRISGEILDFFAEISAEVTVFIRSLSPLTCWPRSLHPCRARGGNIKTWCSWRMVFFSPILWPLKQWEWW